MPFRTRWMITGTLETLAPLHIGTGESDYSRAGLRNEKTGQQQEVQAVARMLNGTRSVPCIPATSLKGVLRAWLEARYKTTEHFREAFGWQEEHGDKGRGGLLEFQDSPAVEGPSVQKPGPWWNEDRMTCAVTSVTIDRRCKVARHGRLFSLEYVPAGTKFSVCITAQNCEEDVIGLALAALEQFREGSGGIALGTDANNGWGRMKWEPAQVCRIQPEDVVAWIQSGAPSCGYGMVQKTVPPSDWQRWRREALCDVGDVAQDYAEIDVELKFDGGFLVNDPSESGTTRAGRPNHVALLDRFGHAVLPASSIRGAMRSQAEKIVRTMADNDDAAAYSDSDLPALRSLAEVKSLAKRGCPVTVLFGGPGWKAPLEFCDFRSPAPVKTVKQEFVGIDRFTGGGDDGRKFNADVVFDPMLKGTIRLDVGRLVTVGAGKWVLGLLALVLRDLCEGDITLGFGASKGFGMCQGRITGWRLPRRIPTDWTYENWKGQLPESLDLDQIDWVEALEGRLAGRMGEAAHG